MAGSVEEWCQDWYADKYYAHSPTNDPPGPDTGTGRVVRGGFWGSDADMCRSADRSDRLPTDPSVCMGFRCTYTPGVVAPAPAAVPAAPTAPVLTPVEAGAIGSVVRISTPKGDIVIELFDRQSPITTGSFLLLAQKGFYNGLTFHRVVPGFVIQGGDPKGDGTGGPGFTLPDEFDPKIPFDRGIVAMAKTDDPNSAGSQFFVCLGGPDAVGFLTGHYAAFGRVLEGMDVADKIVVGDKMTAVTVLKESADAAKARAAAAVCRITG
jgi:cyclophilin family peptidyl-prolyl cis-trans isomerase